MGTTQSSHCLSFQPDETNQVKKDPCSTSRNSTYTSSSRNTSRNRNNYNDPIGHNKALYFICSCPCSTIHDSTNTSTNTSTSSSTEAAATAVSSSSSMIVASKRTTIGNLLCFSNTLDLEDMDDDETTHTTSLHSDLNSNYRYYYRNARNKSLQERHCPNIDELNLDGIHPSKGPYLGTISWEPQSPMDCTKSLLDLSHHDPHEEQGEEDDDVVENDHVVDVVVDVVGNDDNPYNTTHLLEKRVMDEGEIVGNPVPSWQTVSPIPASSSPLAYTVVQAKHPSDLIISTCTPSESGNEIEISFIPPKRLFQESFTDLDNHDCDHHHNHHVAQKASPHKDASTTPCQSTILSTSNDTMKKIQHKSIAISNGILYHPQHKELEDAPPAPPPSSSSISPSQHHNATTTSSITIQSSETDGGHASSLPDGVHKWGMMHINTLPSFQHGRPIRLNMKESYRGYETRVVMGEGRLDNDDDDDDDNHHDVILDLSNLSLLSDATQQEHFFSYDPYFSLGQYVITTLEGGQYGNGLCVQMGERYMTLQDQNERVWGVIRSRHTWIPSAVIYSPKQRFCGQVASSHRPLEHKSDDGGGYGGVELYPWALVKKHGRRMDHDVTIHMVAEPNVTSSFELLGGLFEKKPMFRSRHGFDGVGNHQSTVVYRVARDDGCGVEREYPCCKSVRNATQKDLFHVTIAPGIDPLLIICYMAAHSKMDVEPKLCDD